MTPTTENDFTTEMLRSLNKMLMNQIADLRRQNLELREQMEELSDVVFVYEHARTKKGSFEHESPL